MFRITIFSLLSIPVLLFATDKMIAINKSNHLLITEINETTSKMDNLKLTNEEMIDEMKKSIKDIEGRENAFNKSKRISTWSDQLSDDREKFINAKLIKKLVAENICSINLENSFSRCPSGYNAQVIMKDNIVTNEGWFSVSSGCSSDPIAMFKYNVPASTIEAKISDKAGYVPLYEFCKIYKTAKKSL